MENIWQRGKALLEQVKTHQGLRKYGQNTLWLFIEKAVRMLVGFTVGIYVARQLGPEQFGILNFAISFVAIFSVIISMGMDQLLVRELVNKPEESDALLGTTLVLQAGGFVIMLGGVGLGLVYSHNSSVTNLMIMIIAGGYAFQIFQVLDSYFQSRVLSKYVSISQMIAWTMVSLLRAWFAWKQFPLVYFAGLEATNMVLAGAGYIVSYHWLGLSPRTWRFDFHLARILLRDSWPLIIQGMMGILYMRISQVMINYMLGPTEVGYYVVAVRLAELWYFIPMLISASLFPAIIMAKSISVELYESRLKRLYAFLIWLMVGISLVMTCISYPLIRILYGQAYLPAAPVLIIYSWSTVIIAFAAVFGKWMINENLQKIIMVSGIIGTVFNLILNYILIRKVGICGAALAALVAPLLGNLVMAICSVTIRSHFRLLLESFLVYSVFVRKKPKTH